MKTVNILLLSRNRLILILAFCLALSAKCQTILIEDDTLKSFFCANYPIATSSDCSLLDTAILNSTYTDPQLIGLEGSGVKNADIFIHFQSVDSLSLRRNGLTSFPEDLRSWYPIRRLELSFNELKKAPIYLDNGADVGKVGVKFLYLEVNSLSSLPKAWDTLSNNITVVLDVSHNQLTDCPDFAGLSRITRLDLRFNNLDFDDLVRIKSHPKFFDKLRNFQLFPQRPFDLNFENTSFSLRQSTRLVVGNKMGGDNFLLLNNGVVVDSSKTGEFDIIFSKDSDFGSYTVRIRSEEFPDTNDYLFSEEYEITRIPVQKKDVFVFSPNGDGIEDDFLVQGSGKAVFLDSQGLEIRAEKLPFKWLGDNSNGQPLAPGLYIIQKENGEYDEVLISY